MVKMTVKDLYLSWFNDFCTAERFAEYYGLSIYTARRIIRLGRKTNNFTKKTLVGL